MLTSTVSSGGDIFHRNAHRHSHSLTEIFVVSPLPHPHHPPPHTLQHVPNILVLCVVRRCPRTFPLIFFYLPSCHHHQFSVALTTLASCVSYKNTHPDKFVYLLERCLAIFFFLTVYLRPFPLTQTPYPRQALPYPTSLRVGG